jgi:Cu/Ag efflux pump CusA
VSSVGGQIGRAIQSDQAVDVSSGEVWVTLDAEADYDDTLATITGLASGFTDVTSEVKTYSEERVSDMLQDSTQDIAVRLYGENADVLASKAAEVEELVGGIDGISGVNIDETPQETVVEVQVDIDAAREFGIKPGDVRRSASSLIGGITVGHLFQEQKVFDVVVWGAPAIRQGTADLERMLIDTPRGDTVRLGEVANVTPVESPAVIRHESVSRYVEMTADVSGRDVDDVATEVDDVVKQMEFPLEHHAEVLGDYEDRQDEQTSLIALVLAAALAVFLLLQAAFRSWRLAILAFLSLPLAVVGGLVAVLLTGGTIGLGAVVGLIAVLGIAARTIVLQVRHFQHLQYEEGATFGPGLVLRGTRDRLAPVVMSTLAIALLLAPVVVTGAGSGLEIVHPMATVVLGGLVTTLVVTLFVIPAIYLRYGSVSDVDTSDDLFTDVPVPRSAQG